jgi:hypothetical protein
MAVIVDGVALNDWVVLAETRLPPSKADVQWANIEGGVDIDVSGALTGGIPKRNRVHAQIRIMLDSGESVFEARARLLPLFDGQKISVGFPERPGVHLEGRAWLSDWPTVIGQVPTFTLNLDALPYWFSDDGFELSVVASDAPGTDFLLSATGFPVMPTVTVTGGEVTLHLPKGDQLLGPGKYPHIGLLKIMPGVDLSGTLEGDGSSSALFVYPLGGVA